MRKIKFGTMALSAFLLLSPITFAEENVPTEIVEESAKTVMTLEEAINYALENNANIIDVARTQEDQEDTYKEAKKTYQSWKNKLKFESGYSFETPADFLDCWGHSYEMAELQYESFLASKEGAEKTVAYNVMNLAYTIDEINKSILLLEKTVEKQENDVRIAEVKVSLDMITQNDLDTAISTLASTKLQLASVKSTLTSLEISLKSLMGYDVLQKLEIVLPEHELKILEVENLAETIESSLETNSSAIMANIMFKQKEQQYLLATQTHFFETREAIKEAKENFSDAENRLNNSVNSVKENLLLLYQEIKMNENETILAKEDYEQLQRQYKQMEVMYELDMITKHDFDAFEIALMNAQNAYEAALHKNSLLNERWEIALTVGDVVSEAGQQALQQQQVLQQQMQQQQAAQQQVQQLQQLQELLQMLQMPQAPQM